MSSEVEVNVKTASPTVEGELVHDSEEYESAEEIEVEEEEYEEEEIEEEVDDEEDDDQQKDEDGKEKPLDDDEDRKNPQFIPKKGYFYEHDDRMTGEPGEEDEEAPPNDERPRKDSSTVTPKPKVVADRWCHDMFDENEQAPKSPGELEERYGYDIRSDDMAPRARRKRAYGRGPSKYTRNWEEEEAYHRPRGGFRGRRAGPRGPGRDSRQPARRGSKGYDEDFPQLPEDSNNTKDPETKTGDAKTATTPKSEVRDRQRTNNPRTPRGDDREENDGNEDRDRSYGRGQGRGARGRGGRRNEFANRNRYPDRRGSGPMTEANNTSNNRVKSREERDWEQKVDKIREQEKIQKQSNGTRGNFSPAEKETPSKNSNARPQQQPATKKSTLPFTNTEYTGSASLTANRNQEMRSANYESGSGNERDNISIKVINAGPEQGNREVRISEKERWAAGTQGSGQRADRSQSQPSSRSQENQPQQQQQQPLETAKPKRFSTQRQKQDAPLNTAPVSASPPPRGVGAASSPQPLGVQMAATGPPSVVSGYPAPHSQGYYEQVPVQMPTNYDTQGYEGSGASPITVPISAHGQSVSPSLWTTQHSAYSTSPYPSPPTGPPSVQPPYDPSAYISAPQPQIFAPPPHPHPQFISDPTIINYVPPGPPQTYGAPFHPQGFQGYQPVNPGPELYHGGVTYYSPQTQMQRPHMMVPTKRPKSVLQLVEPAKRDMRQGPRPHLPTQEEALIMSDMYLHQYREESLPHVVDYMNTSTTSSEFTSSKSSTEQQLAQKFEESVRLQPKIERLKKSPSPAPLDLSESPSWADQMADLTPLSSPQTSEQSSRKNSDFQGTSLEKLVGGEGNHVVKSE